MAQLGFGNGSSYPNAIDARQVFRNGSTVAPDSDTRLDAEAINDSLAAIIAIETALGAGVNGQYGSLAARLNQTIPGYGGQPGIISFTNALTVNIPGTQHNVGQAALLWRMYDNQIPAHGIQAGAASFAVSPSTYDVTLQFGIPLSGSIALGAQTPLYLANFTNATTVSVPGTVHQLPNADLLFQVYLHTAPGDPWQATMPGSLTVDPTTRDVLMTFGIPLTGTLVLSAGGPVYATSFTAMTTFTIPGSVHLLGTPAIVYQFYDDQVPMAALADPDVSVDPSTFDIVVTFAIPMSGRAIFAATSTFTGKDFELRDGGIVNQTAVRVRSQLGELLLQAGSNNLIQMLNALGTAALTLDWTTAGMALLRTAQQLHLQGQDFDVRDGGVVGTDAVRMASQGGQLLLQTGTSDLTQLLNAHGTAGLTVGFAGTQFVTLASSSGRWLGLSGDEIYVGSTPGANQTLMFTNQGSLNFRAGAGTFGEQIVFYSHTGIPRLNLQTLTGNVGIGIVPAYPLHLGDPTAVKPGGGPWLAPSGRAIKDAIEPFTDGIETVLALEPVTFQYNGLGDVPQSDTRHIGLTAEDVQPVAPYMVQSTMRPLAPSEPPSPQYILDTAALPYLLINAVKTQQAQIEAMRQRQDRLEQQVMLLATRLAALDGTQEDAPA